MPYPACLRRRHRFAPAAAAPLLGALLLLLNLLPLPPLPALLLPPADAAVPAAGLAGPDAPASPDGSMARAYRCDGLPLSATLHPGAVDDPAIPNVSAGTLPGAFLELHWQRAGEAITLQLPRTNNAGPPSFTDGKWWWSLENPDHPRFRLRQGRGDIQDFICEPA